MIEIKRIYRQTMPRMKLVGKCYAEEEKVNGTFSHQWGEWFQNDWFSPLRMPDAAERLEGCDAHIGACGCGEGEPFEDCDAYIGLCRCKEGEPFQYWIGVFLPVDFPVPEGYDSVTLEAGDIGVAWIYGKEPDIYTCCCLDALRKEGFEWTADKNGVKWCFERYVCPRFTVPDEKGNVILDMCFYVE